MEFDLWPSAPSWVDLAPASVRGLDLLGLRLPAQSIGLSLLNGVTTVTPKVRYLSFRAFVAEAYLSAPEALADSRQLFNEFARQAEAAFAVSNVTIDPNATGIVGVDGASRLLDEADSQVELKRIVEQLATNLYAGPAEDLGLVKVRGNGLPVPTQQRGRPLAVALGEAWGQTRIGRRLLDREVLESASTDDLEKFAEVSQIDALGSDERGLLIDAICPIEPLDSEVERLRTYALLLNLAGELGRVPTEEDVFKMVSEVTNDVPPVLLPSVDGWLVYQVRDALAVAHEVALAEVVKFLEAEPAATGRSMPARLVMQRLLEDPAPFLALWGDLGLPNGDKDLLSQPFDSVVESVLENCSIGLSERRGLRRWSDPFGEWELIGARQGYGRGALLLMPLAWILSRWRTEAGVRERLPLFDGLSLGGATRLGLRETVFPLLEAFSVHGQTLGQAVSELTRTTVEQHVQIALSRLAQDPRRDVALMTTEQGFWRYRRGFSPGRTQSRIGIAVDWLAQLGLIDRGGRTPEGDSVFKRSIESLEGSGGS